MKFWTLAVLVTASCSAPSPTSSAPPASAVSVPTAKGSRMSALLSASVVGQKPARPPLSSLQVDLVIKNPNADARWLLIDRAIPHKEGGVDKLEQLTAAGNPVAIGRLLGTGGRYAVLLAGGAQVTLRKLEIAWWREGDASTVTLGLELGSAVTVGGEPLASWFAGDPTVSGTVEVDVSAAQHTASHKTADRAEVSLVVADSQRETTTLAIP